MLTGTGQCTAGGQIRGSYHRMGVGGRRGGQTTTAPRPAPRWSSSGPADAAGRGRHRNTVQRLDAPGNRR